MEIRVDAVLQFEKLLLITMTNCLIICQLFAAATAPGQLDRVCFGEYCQFLVVQQGAVRFLDYTPPTRSFKIGSYVRSDQDLVPSTEAPIRDMRSGHGWHIVVSAFLDHDEGGTGLRLHFFSPSGAPAGRYDVLSELEQVELGTLLGSSEEILAVTSTEEHAYNVQTVIWLLANHGVPKLLLRVPGVFGTFVNGERGDGPGVWISRETYDGVHAETKGRVNEFWAWDRQRKLLTVRKK